MPDPATLSFLDPAAGILALSIGLPVLLLFYFLKLRRRAVRVSSSMLWQDAARDLQVNVPWRLIRPSWLLLLQLLILALLAGALARPVLEVRTLPPGRTIIVVDHSASMAAPGPGGGTTRLEVAKSRAADLLRRLAEARDARFSIVSSASRPVVRYSDGADAGAAIAAISAIEQTDEPGDPEPLFQLLKAMTAPASGDSEGRDATPVRVVLLSDGNDAERLQRGTATTLAGLGDVEFEFVRVGQPESERPPENAAIVALSARRDYDDPSLIRVFCAVEHNADRARSIALKATLVTDSSNSPLDIGAWTLDLPRASPDAPGRATRSFELIAPAGGLLELRLIASDALASDNAAWMMLESPAPPRIWLVRPDDAALTAASASLVDAIEAIVGARPRAVSATEYESASSIDADIVIFDAVRPSRVPPIPTISFGAGLPIPALLVEPIEIARPTQVAFWTRSDPLMRGVTFAATIINRPRAIVLPDTEAPGAAVREARVIARGSDGPLIAELRDTARRIVIAFTLDETNWWKEPSFPVFMANAIEQLAGAANTEGEAGTIAHTGASVDLRWSPTTSDAVVTGPAGFSRRLPPAPSGMIAVGSLPFAGVYSVDGRPAIAASVLDPIESGLATRDTLTIAGRSVATTAVARLAPREIWWWFVLAAAALLAIEWWAFALRMRT